MTLKPLALEMIREMTTKTRMDYYIVYYPYYLYPLFTTIFQWLYLGDDLILVIGTYRVSFIFYIILCNMIHVYITSVMVSTSRNINVMAKYLRTPFRCSKHSFNIFPFLFRIYLIDQIIPKFIFRSSTFKKDRRIIIFAFYGLPMICIWTHISSSVHVI